MIFIIVVHKAARYVLDVDKFYSGSQCTGSDAIGRTGIFGSKLTAQRNDLRTAQQSGTETVLPPPREILENGQHAEDGGADRREGFSDTG